MKKRIFCPFCTRIFGVPELYKGHNLWTMGNGDYVYFICDGCGKEYWISERDFDDLGDNKK